MTNLHELLIQAAGELDKMASQSAHKISDQLRQAAEQCINQREQLARWMLGKGFSTGHGDTTADLLAELDSQITEQFRWIPVSERLPDKSGPTRSRSVLAYCPDIKCTFTACYNYEFHEWEFFATGAGTMNEHVSHWMPLPDPPGGE